MGGEGHDAHRHDGSLSAGQGPDCRQKLICPAAINDTQDGTPALGQAERPLAPILRRIPLTGGTVAGSLAIAASWACDASPRI